MLHTEEKSPSSDVPAHKNPLNQKDQGTNEHTSLMNGESDFRKLVKNGAYKIDKSLFIQAVIDDKDSSVLMLRPVRFGKSCNLSMLNYYYAKPIDSSDHENAHLFKLLNIGLIKNSDKYKQKQGKYYVIFLSFKDIKDEGDHAKFQKIKALVREQYKYFYSILHGDNLLGDDKIYYEMILNDEKGEVDDYAKALLNLARLLYNKSNNQKVILLIDEYDTPITAPITATYNESINKTMRNFMHALLSPVLNDNVYLEKIVITGILNIFDDMPSRIKVHGLINDTTYSEYFGFSKEDIKNLIKDYQKLNKADEKIWEWCGGIRVGNKIMSNPSSVIEYILANRNRETQRSPSPSSEDTNHKWIKKTKPQVAEGLTKALTEIMDTGSTSRSVAMNFDLANIDQDEKALFSFLLMTGYLTLCDDYSSSVKSDENISYKLKFPNENSKLFFQKNFGDLFKKNNTPPRGSLLPKRDFQLSTSTLFSRSTQFSNNNLNFTRNPSPLSNASVSSDIQSFTPTNNNPPTALTTNIISRTLSFSSVLSSHGASSLSGYDIYLMPNLPESKELYKNSYILVEQPLLQNIHLHSNRRPLVNSEDVDFQVLVNNSNLVLGHALKYGDSFFDAVAQALTDKGFAVLGQSTQPPHKHLRMLCDAYLQEINKSSPAQNWVKTAMNRNKERGGSDYETCLVQLKYTQDEMEKLHQQNFYDGLSTWGCPSIEGRILCESLSQQLGQSICLHVIGIRETENNFIKTHWLVDSQGQHTIDENDVDYTNKNWISLVSFSSHYVPLMKHPPNSMQLSEPFRRLYYIESDASSRVVKIDRWNEFKEQLTTIGKSKHIHLSLEQHNKLIISNGSRIPLSSTVSSSSIPSLNRRATISNGNARLNLTWSSSNNPSLRRALSSNNFSSHLLHKRSVSNSVSQPVHPPHNRNQSVTSTASRSPDKPQPKRK